MSTLELEIINKLCKYIDKVITLKQFSDWFIPATYEIPKEEGSAKSLAYSIKLCFAEYTNGHWTKEELRERLIDIIL